MEQSRGRGERGEKRERTTSCSSFSLCSLPICLFFPMLEIWRMCSGSRRTWSNSSFSPSCRRRSRGTQALCENESDPCQRGEVAEWDRRGGKGGRKDVRHPLVAEVVDCDFFLPVLRPFLEAYRQVVRFRVDDLACESRG